MHSKRRAFSLRKELVDLVVPRHSRPSQLDDVHVITRQIELAIRLNELGPAEVGALGHRAEVVRSRCSASIDDTIVISGSVCFGLGGLEKMMDGPHVHAMLIQPRTLQVLV